MAMSTEIRTSNQSRASTKIVIGFVALVALGYFGYNFYENRAIGNLKYAPLEPGVVNLVGVDTAKGGYHIVVANRIAQLVQTANGAFEAQGQDPSQGGGGDDSDAQKKKVPLMEMIQTLQEKSAAVGPFVSILNDMKQEDVNDKAKDWSKADIEKALAGDKSLKDKLQADLNTNLDGSPLAQFDPKTFQTGITIHLPVTMTIPSPTGDKQVTGDLLFPFQTRLMLALEQRVATESNLYDNKVLAGYYAEVAKPFMTDPKQRQNVAEALKQIISQANVDGMTELPQKVLGSLQILANDQLIKHASYTTEDTPKGPVCNMEIELTDEGRNRLWQYSRDKVGTQLLLVVDGVAVSAIQIKDVLAQTNLTISNLPDETIVKNAVNKINSMNKASGQ